MFPVGDLNAIGVQLAFQAQLQIEVLDSGADASLVSETSWVAVLGSDGAPESPACRLAASWSLIFCVLAICSLTLRTSG